MQSLTWNGISLQLLNQTLLPGKIEHIECTNYRIVAEAIKRLEVRGAPAIGAAAAFAMVLGARELSCKLESFWHKLSLIAEEVKQTRPTAINLAWAVDRMVTTAQNYKNHTTIDQILVIMEKEAIAIFEEDIVMNEKISNYGAELFSDSKIAILTHCNAGALATVAFGTALGVIRKAHSDGKVSRVFADETRPLLQGARLTAFELMQDQIPVTLITDSMAGWVMKNNMVQAVIVGADRITLNGDVANKIGTYSVAVLAKEHGIPFYVAAPSSTFDFSMNNGNEIPIEERCKTEVTSVGGIELAPEGVDVFNPAFDVTPNHLVTAIVTEFGVLKAPYDKAILKLKQQKGGY